MGNRPRGTYGKKINRFQKLEKPLYNVLERNLKGVNETKALAAATITAKYLEPPSVGSTIRYNQVPWETLSIEQYERIASGEDAATVVGGGADKDKS